MAQFLPIGSNLSLDYRRHEFQQQEINNEMADFSTQQLTNGAL
jgi:hypothetical protein